MSEKKNRSLKLGKSDEPPPDDEKWSFDATLRVPSFFFHDMYITPSQSLFRGLIHKLKIAPGAPTPIYIGSKSAVWIDGDRFVIHDMQQA